ncbi:MAG: hypothetical protein ACI94Y_001143 [Maribacter sp.]|jgi:hypothetical protein
MFIYKVKLNCSMRLYLLFFLLLSIIQLAEAKTEKYRCMWREDPSTTMTIGWNQLNGTNPILYLDIENKGTEISTYATSHTVSRTVWYKKMNNHFVRLSKLQANTIYYFMIKDSNSESKVMSFRTLPNDDDSSLSIIAGGDSRNHRTHRQNANKMVAKLRPHLVMFGGDMTGSDGSSSWKKWMDDWQLTMGDDGRITPIIAARGNHERSNSSIYHLFDVPNPEIYYALTLGNNMVRSYTLNSLIAPGGHQRDWLENDLDKHKEVRWKMVQYHHPIRPHVSRKSEKPSQQKYWAPLFYEYEVDLVVECDAHVVKTTYPVRPSRKKGSEEGFIRDDAKGTVYVGEGCWGAPLRRNDDNKKWTRASGSFNQFKWIFVDFEKIEVRTVKTYNPDVIPQLNDATRFYISDELDIWKPKTGDVVLIGITAKDDLGNSDESAIDAEKQEIEISENKESVAQNNTSGEDIETEMLREENPLLGKELEQSDTVNYESISSAIIPISSASHGIENNYTKWNRWIVILFFSVLILFMLYPFYPNFKRLNVFNKE